MTNAIEGHLLERFSGVVDGIYGAALNPDQWPAAVKSIADLHDCPQALMFTVEPNPPAGGFIFPYGMSEENMQLRATYARHDIWVQRAVERDLIHDGTVMLTEDLTTREELESSVIFRELLRKMDIHHICSGIVFSGRVPGTNMTAASLFKGGASGGFHDIDRKLHSLTVGHLSRAIGTMHRLRDAEFRLASSTAALNRLGVGVFLFGERGNVLFANTSATVMMGANDGIVLRAGNGLHDAAGWLLAARPEDSGHLQKRIAEAVSMDPLPGGHFTQGLALARRSGKRPYVVQLSRLAPDNEFSFHDRLACAIGFLTDPDATPSIPPGLLESAYGLTSAEAALSRELLSGDSLEIIATRLSVAVSTVRTHLNGVFAKTGTNRQAQLVKLLMGLASGKV